MKRYCGNLVQAFKSIEVRPNRRSHSIIDPKKEYVLSLDGKQTSPGLLNESEGDVNLWGYEGPPTLQDNLDKLGEEENVILEIVNKAGRDDNCLDDFVSDIKCRSNYYQAHL